MHLKVRAYFSKSQVNNTQRPILLIHSHCQPISVSNYRFTRLLEAWGSLAGAAGVETILTSVF